MTFTTKFNIGDNVWVITSDNRARCCPIVSVNIYQYSGEPYVINYSIKLDIEESNPFGDKFEIITVKEKDAFLTKEELIESLN